MKVRSIYALVLACAGASSTAFAQQAATQPASATTAATDSVESQILELQKEWEEQSARFQQRLDQLKNELQAQEAKKTDMHPSAKTTVPNGMPLAVAPEVAQQSADVSATAVPVLPASPKQTAWEPTSIRYKGVTLTPGGFFAGESIWRQRSLNADIYTDFNATPYPDAGEAHISEWVPSARQSRLSLLADGKTPFGKVSGYFEGDFLSAGTTSNNLQTNSYTLRIRQLWAQAQKGRFTFTGGQMWTLLSEDKEKAQPGKEEFPLIFDGNVHVGFTYVRQMGYRLQYAATPKITAAVALENSQYQFSASNAPSNFFFGGAGAAGGLNNPDANYTNQVAPDVLAKVTYDPGYGHYELGGVARFFRDRYYPNGALSSGAQNDTKLGGGLVANARFPVTSKADIGLHLVTGDGTGRYGASLLPDITVKPDGTLEPLRNLQGLLSLELHPTKKLDLFGYAGTEYVQRTFYRNPAGELVGYAPPSASNSGCSTEVTPTAGTGYAPGADTCLRATKAITEGSAGYVYRIYSGPAGKLQYGLAYSYLTRQGWSGVGGSPKATNNFVYTSFRYYLP
jgi:hypothetical protein